jgi:hypothetical protein
MSGWLGPCPDSILENVPMSESASPAGPLHHTHKHINTSSTLREWPTTQSLPSDASRVTCIRGMENVNHLMGRKVLLLTPPMQGR